ncbi:hypothetical protein L6452_02532 [Arctium lappa]|uniref:Uncharacterized protein n=1 Tax=Arctium lappa TaxID=4217 RepID=A0ACB9FJ63_ARCLA|nr:hypothetical protein L6452_02532 [Arctium lappa]
MPRVIRQRPVIKAWSLNKLRIREVEELANGGQPQPGDEPNDGAEQVILGSDGKVDENRELETPTQFFQHPDVIPDVDVAIWEEMSRKKGTTSSALPLDSIPSFSLGLTQ